MLWRQSKLPMPDYVIGVPTGATDLAQEVTKIIGAQFVAMKKINGRITLSAVITGKVMVVEDFITAATGVIEAINILALLPGVEILECVFAIINRGALEYVDIAAIGRFGILAIASKKINLWEPTPGACLLCAKFDSKAVYPKRTDKDWCDLIGSQKILVE